MKTHALLIPLTCLSLATFSQAEIFVLKDGSRLEGKILKETPESYVLEVQITKSIKDEKTLAKADVKEVEAEKFDEKAWEKIKDLVPTPDLLTNDDYDKRIVSLATFVKEYPKSKLVPKANEMLSTLKAEGTAIVAGGVKLEGKVITAADYKANAYELDAKVLEARIKAAVERGDLVGALRGITKIETDYKTTGSYSAILPIKKKVLQSYKAQINEQLSTYEARAAQRASGLARMAQADRISSERAIEEERAAAEKRFKSDEAAEQIWVTTDPYHRESLESAQSAIDTELSAAPFTNDKGDGGKVFRKVLQLTETSSDLDVIRDAVNQASDFEMPERYLVILQNAAKAKGVTF